MVVTHPHPLYGGDMDHPVVMSIARTYGSQGYTSLRFNFRGVGKSQGHFDDGVGEQTDVRAACAFLKARGIDRIDMAGYSFGAWVIAQIGCSNAFTGDMAMVSPPVAFMDFKEVGELPCLKVVVAGGRDDIAPADRVQTMMSRWNPTATFKLIKHADHFYSNALSELEAILSASIE